MTLHSRCSRALTFENVRKEAWASSVTLSSFSERQHEALMRQSAKMMEPRERKKEREREGERERERRRERESL